MPRWWQPDTIVTKASGESAVARKKPEKPKTGVASSKDILDRLKANDKSAVPEFREMLKECPSLIDLGGNLAKTAEEILVNGITGGQLVFDELHAAKLAELRAELAGPQPSRLERLLVERVVACWLQVYHADAIAAQEENPTLAKGDYNQRRQDRAHWRFLSAVKTLATVRRLALPTFVAVNVTGSVETKEAEPAPMLAIETAGA
jgi:hypothetical protein